jgi:hypothetical protein
MSKETFPGICNYIKSLDGRHNRVVFNFNRYEDGIVARKIDRDSFKGYYRSSFQADLGHTWQVSLGSSEDANELEHLLIQAGLHPDNE